MTDPKRNVKITQEGDILTIVIDISEAGRPSGSGKTTTIATTGRPQQVATTSDGEAVFAGINVYKYPPRG